MRLSSLPLMAVALAALAATPTRAQVAGAPPDGLAGDAALEAFLVDTTGAALRIEEARLRAAQAELRQVSGWRALAPELQLFVSVSTRGQLFAPVRYDGYDPLYAALQRWPGDTWGVTLSWNLDQLLDRTPRARARAAVDAARARIDLARHRADALRARREETRRREDERTRAEAARRAERERRRAHDRARLTDERAFLARRLDAQRELLRLAETDYELGDGAYAALARQRLAVLEAEHALVRCDHQFAALDAGLDPSPLADALPTPPDGASGD